MAFIIKFPFLALGRNPSKSNKHKGSKSNTPN